jgi:SRR1
MTANEWTIVNKKGKSKFLTHDNNETISTGSLKRNLKKHLSILQTDDSDNGLDWTKEAINGYIDDLNQLVELIRKQSVHSTAITCIRECCEKYCARNINTSTECNVYLIGLGIGHICKSQSSMLQLSYFMTLHRSLQELLTDQTSLHISVYDPVASPQDNAIYTQLNIDVSPSNSKGKMLSVDTDSLYLYFMPHCPYQLYNNILWSHWRQLPNLIIIGNR